MTSEKYPSITFETGIRHEALRLLYYLKRLPDQELQQRGFLVMPHTKIKNNRRVIYIPNLSYSSIPHLWQQIAKLNPTTPMTAPDNLINQIMNLLKPTYQPPPVNIFQIPQQFFSNLFKLLPEYKSIIKHINIIITCCGITSQFNIIDSRHQVLTIYARQDAHITDIYQVIILSLIRNQLQNHESRSWLEIEAISDFLLNHTPLKRYLPPCSPIPMMLSLQQKQSGKLYQLSHDYQSHLGIPTQNNWSIKDHHLYYQSTLIPNLTQRQLGLLSLLIKNYGQIVSLDLIADTLWPQGENYSLWALVKEIARIRKCLVASNLPGSLIQAHRKLGYSLL